MPAALRRSARVCETVHAICGWALASAMRRPHPQLIWPSNGIRNGQTCLQRDDAYFPSSLGSAAPCQPPAPADPPTRCIASFAITGAIAVSARLPPCLRTIKAVPLCIGTTLIPCPMAVRGLERCEMARPNSNSTTPAIRWYGALTVGTCPSSGREPWRELFPPKAR